MRNFMKAILGAGLFFMVSCTADDATIVSDPVNQEPPSEIRECDCPVKNIKIFVPTRDTVVMSSTVRHYNDGLCGNIRSIPLPSNTIPGILEYWTVEDCRGL